MKDTFNSKLFKIAIIVILLLGIAFVVYKVVNIHHYSVLRNIRVGDDAYNAFNNLQSTSIKLFTNNGNLYAWNCTDNIINQIIGNGETKYITELPMDVLATHGDFIYGIKYFPYNSLMGELCSYNITTDKMQIHGKVEVLPTIEKPEILCSTFTNDGMFYVPCVFPTEETYYKILNGTTKETVDFPQTLQVGNSLIWIEDELIKCQQNNGVVSLSDMIPKGQKYLLQTEYGVLVYNTWNKTNLLYIIKENGKVCELFADSQRDCLSSINFYDKYVYLSLIRYDIGQELFVGWDNDSLTGTFRISLVDGSIEKISDTYYEALYIFDSSGIFAIDGKQRIYKIGFDGNILGVVLK